MEIHGFNKTTLLDYPEYVAATVFTGGCNFRCPFCHNAGLVMEPKRQQLIPEGEVLAHLQKRQGILDGVCITGGEPTLQRDLKDFIKKLKDMGYLVKLDTNGYRPQVLRELLSEEMLDYVAMDIKASREKYALAAGVSNLDLSVIEESVEILKSAGIPYEFRTTVVKGIHDIQEFESIGSWLSGCRAYYLQGFQENENIIALRAGATCFSAFAPKDMESMAEIARKYIDKVILRGVE
ncbi:MAG: anaerobic ribonucleoside-triphosphate reductase activating protein [Lachnospiraceae bacterium]|nr:anaerobic ribonucleoside-triphosphate reductase activating protein [Lachnospiraceae bacterium]